MTRRVLVLDGMSAETLDEAAALARPGDEWAIVLFGDSPVLAQRRYRSQLDGLGRWRFVPLEPFAARAHDEVADFVSGFVRDLPHQDLHGSSLSSLLGDRWWSLETSERNPFRNKWIGLLYRLALVQHVLSSGPFDELVVACKDPDLRALLAQDISGRPPTRRLGRVAPPRSRGWGALVRYWIGALRTVRSLLTMLVVLRFVDPHERAPAPGAVAVHTTYPYFWLDAFGGATERFLSALPSADSFYLGWIDDPGVVWRRRSAAAKVLRAKRIIPLQRWLGPRDALALLSPAGFIRLLRFRRVRDAITGGFQGHDIGRLIAEDLERSLSSPQLFHAELVYRAVSRFAERSAPAAVLYRFECQLWENAIVLALRGVLPSIGFRHTPFGARFLLVRLAPGEVAARPLPDRLLVTGPVGAARLRKEGYPPERIAVCGPQRHPALIGARPRAPLPEGPFTAYVAISTVLEETTVLIGALAEACSELPELTLLVRTHPALALSAGSLSRLFADAGLSGRWSLAPSDLYQGLALCHVALMVPSTLAFEAVALGIMPVVFENPGTYNANSIAEHADAFFIARSPLELGSALGAVRQGSPVVAAMRERWRGLLEQVFSDLDTPLESQLAAALDAVGVDVSDAAEARR